ncbi:glycoside hydrolase N-terminal domain-containing protein, partial [Planctomycetota bacterium]
MVFKLRIAAVLSMLILMAGVTNAVESGNELKFFYLEPASQWQDGLPVGNGQVGAMVMGTVPQERIGLNHSWLWRDSKLRGRTNPKVAHHLPYIRKLFFEGKLIEASNAAHRLLGSQGVSNGNPPLHYEVHYGPDPFQPAGDLYINFPGQGDVEDYRRELDLSTAIARVTYGKNNVKYTREVFASSTEGIIVVRLSADKRNMITCSAELSRIEDPECTLMPWAEGERFGFVGEFYEKKRFAITAAVSLKGGEGEAFINEGRSGFRIKGADEALILLSITTDHNTNDPKGLCTKQLDWVALITSWRLLLVTPFCSIT